MDKAYTISLQMLEQRGYKIIEKESDRVIALKQDQNKVIVFFSDSAKFNVKNIQMYITIMDELEILHSIIVYKDGVTAFTKKAIEQSLEMTFELFSEDDLQYNITKHRLQPKFDRLPEEEAIQFKKDFGSKFKILRKDDPIARFYFYQKGDVIRITYSNNYIDYRIVK
jgi:DNA-directed RNA polymerase subunit H (RpoH/RPB5)